MRRSRATARNPEAGQSQLSPEINSEPIISCCFRASRNSGGQVQSTCWEPDHDRWGRAHGWIIEHFLDITQPLGPISEFFTGEHVINAARTVFVLARRKAFFPKFDF